MSGTAGRRVWSIEGFDGATRIFEKTIPLEQMSETEIGALMQRLASRHLTDAEIVCASLRRNSEGYASLLELSTAAGAGQYVVCSGQNPHYMARVVTLDQN